MILCLLFFCLFVGSTITTTVATGNECILKSVMCYYAGDMSQLNPELQDVDPKEIPCECELLIYTRFSIDLSSNVKVNLELLKLVTDLNKPVIVTLARDNGYSDWGQVLGPDGNKNDVEVLCAFATQNNIAGYLIEGLTINYMDFTFNPNIVKNIIPYIKQLSKCKPDFIIGVSIEAHGSTLKNPCELNDLVTFYEIRTYCLNPCNPTLYNGLTPIKMSEHGAEYLFGMEEVALFIKDSQISPTKIVYDIEIAPTESESSKLNSYSLVCNGVFNITGGCVQNTKNLYNKGKFALEQGTGIIVKTLDFDDVKNDCGCDSTFIGFKNIIAGFRGGSQTPCEKFDVQSSKLE
ncbi:hypothetical protein QTP88_025644 [Uroleucon formosanum]